MFPISVPTQHRAEVLCSTTRQEKERKGVYTGNEEIKLSLLTGGMTVHRGTLKNWQKDP